MPRPELVAEARRWLKYAEEDLATASLLMHDDEAPPRHACWLAQQAAEKAIKAALVLEGIEFPRHHDLDALRNLLPTRWAVRQEQPDLAEITEWAVEARYPGDWPIPTPEQAGRAVEQADAVCTSVASDFHRFMDAA